VPSAEATRRGLWLLEGEPSAVGGLRLEVGGGKTRRSEGKKVRIGSMGFCLKPKAKFTRLWRALLKPWA